MNQSIEKKISKKKASVSEMGIYRKSIRKIAHRIYKTRSSQQREMRGVTTDRFEL